MQKMFLLQILLLAQHVSGTGNQFDVTLSPIGQTRSIKIGAEFNLGTGQKVNIEI